MRRPTLRPGPAPKVRGVHPLEVAPKIVAERVGLDGRRHRFYEPTVHARRKAMGMTLVCRIPPWLLPKVDSTSARMGLTRSEYVRLALLRSLQADKGLKPKDLEGYSIQIRSRPASG